MPKINKLLSDAIDEYLVHRSSRRLAAGTIRNDKMWLRQFLAQTGNIYCRSITGRHVDLFFSERSHLDDGTINVSMSALRGFFKLCLERHWIDRHPMNSYKMLKLMPKERMRVPVTEFGQLLDAAGHPRNRMVVALGLFLFLRGGEIATLKVADVNLSLGEVAVTIHKTRVTDQMPINPQLEAEVRRYLTWYTEIHGQPAAHWFFAPAKNSGSPFAKDPVTGKFVTDPATPLPVRMRPMRMITGIEDVVQGALRKLGYPVFREGVHTLRRSGARAFYNELCDRHSNDSALEVVSTMLHHSTLGQTQHYLGITESRRRRDRAVMDGPMFTALEPQPNVVPLREAGG